MDLVPGWNVTEWLVPVVQHMDKDGIWMPLQPV